ncbi:hypothetical protein PY254_13615 [Rhodanobacter sp. AS-Z3]|uniref:hypothetical protein n=1 Tax=Rhodanobacter sp. AS-Z3 TaxID=3031330 RepID=UPI0024789CE3|nr:hypothetical protein [Rhodanobacter sp. AS-Z3]WEN14269.1 hypothetical protein PY254_13615 [Rhodanobacter sp. AS-Z3]
MTRQLLTREQLQKCATQHHSWHDAAAKAPQIAALFKIGSLPFVTLDKKIVLGDQAFRMLRALNDFDRRKVADELLEIASNPKRLDADTGHRNWFQRLLPTRYPFKGYHYKVSYSIRPGMPVLIVDIFMDRDVLKPTLPDSMQRNALYRVGKTGTAQFTPDFKQLGKKSNEVAVALEASWGSAHPMPTHRIETLHAAVNGMQNNLTKAAWLMGTHLETAYVDGASPLANFTLFHNPTDGMRQDLFECAYDKQGVFPCSHNSQHLAAVLKEAQERKHRTRWVAHSQGAIIFSTAVEFALKHYGMRLDCHSVSLHAVGCNIKRAELACERAGITIERVRNNPFDPVANLAGANDLSCSGLARSLKFRGLLLGDDPLASPHTLPYLGLDTYVEQLTFTGHHELARYATQFHPSETA